GAVETAQFDLLLALAEGEDGLDATLTYRSELFDAGTVERMVEHFCALLRTVAADPDRPVGEVSFLGDDERRRVVEIWNATDDAFAADLPVHRRVSAQARRTPE